MAKRRQWDVRGSIARASRRLTGRGGESSRHATAADKRKRSGIIAGSTPAKGVSDKTLPSHKRGPVAHVSDEEKGKDESETVESKQAKGVPWTERLWGNDWR